MFIEAGDEINHDTFILSFFTVESRRRGAMSLQSPFQSHAIVLSLGTTTSLSSSHLFDLVEHAIFY